jgi:RHS repeat-associated protein
MYNLRYLWGTVADQILADEVIDDGTADDVAWALTDHLNSVRDLVEYNPGMDTASVIKHVTYDAFGNVTSDGASAVASLFLFTARPYDADTQLQNNLNRWYDPATGRWMSTDPIGFEAGDGNLYRYVGNGVVAATDPRGLVGPHDPRDPNKPLWPGGPIPGDVPAIDTRHTPGFKLCNRNLEESGMGVCDDVATQCLNFCFVDHCYIQYGPLKQDGTPASGTKGWGIGGGSAGTLPSEETNFHADRCTQLRKARSALMYGKGTHKLGIIATDDEIVDCIKSVPMRMDYEPWGRGRYNCMDWAREAAAACGLE